MDVTDRPILFSAPMARALLDGRKTQTRRIIKPQPEAGFEPWQTETGEWFLAGMHTQVPLPVHFAKGDHLWIREAWRAEARFDDLKPREIPIRAPIYYEAGGGGEEAIPSCAGRYRHGRFMMRWMSRLTALVNDVRVERLQEISEADCIAEGPPELREMRGLGWPLDGIMVVDPEHPHVGMAPRTWYRELWDTINGAGSWASNPWIVAVTFRPECGNIDADRP